MYEEIECYEYRSKLYKLCEEIGLVDKHLRRNKRALANWAIHGSVPILSFSITMFLTIKYWAAMSTSIFFLSWLVIMIGWCMVIYDSCEWHKNSKRPFWLQKYPPKVKAYLRANRLAIRRLFVESNRCEDAVKIFCRDESLMKGSEHYDEIKTRLFQRRAEIDAKMKKFFVELDQAFAPYRRAYQLEGKDGEVRKLEAFLDMVTADGYNNTKDVTAEVAVASLRAEVEHEKDEITAQLTEREGPRLLK